MSVGVICQGCGQPVAVPEGYGRNKIQCPTCGVICPVPAGAGAAPPAARARRAAPAAEPDVNWDAAGAPAAEEPPAAEPAPRRPAEPAREESERPPRRPPQETVFACRRCGRKVRRQGECPTCDAAPVAADERPTIPFMELDEPTPPAEEEDAAPYAVEGADLPTCPKCRKEMEPGAVLCVACGFDRRLRKKLRKVYEPIDRRWETNFSLQQRLTLYAAVHGGSLLLGGVVGAASGGLVEFLVSWLIAGLALAFLLGTYDAVELTRDTRGRVTVTKTWRVAFVKLKPVATEVRGFEGIVKGQWRDAGFWEWFICLWLLCGGLLPAILWWYYIIHLSRFHVSLARDHGHPEVWVYRGRREAQMREIADVLVNATHLRILS